MSKVLVRDVTLNLWGSTVTLPAGARVHLVKGADGIRGDLYAVTDTALLMRLTGNTHDPKYRYAFVDAADVADAQP